MSLFGKLFGRRNETANAESPKGLEGKVEGGKKKVSYWSLFRRITPWIALAYLGGISTLTSLNIWANQRENHTQYTREEIIQMMDSLGIDISGEEFADKYMRDLEIVSGTARFWPRDISDGNNSYEYFPGRIYINGEKRTGKVVLGHEIFHHVAYSSGMNEESFRQMYDIYLKKCSDINESYFSELAILHSKEKPEEYSQEEQQKKVNSLNRIRLVFNSISPKEEFEKMYSSGDVLEEIAADIFNSVSFYPNEHSKNDAGYLALRRQFQPWVDSIHKIKGKPFEVYRPTWKDFPKEFWFNFCSIPWRVYETYIK